MYKTNLVFIVVLVLSVLCVNAITIELKTPANNSFLNNFDRNINFTFNSTWGLGGIDPSQHENVSNCSLWTNSSSIPMFTSPLKNVSIDDLGLDDRIVNGSVGLSHMNYSFEFDGTFFYSISCLNFTNASIFSGNMFSTNFTIIIDTVPPTISYSMNNNSVDQNDTITFSALISDETQLFGANITYNLSGVLTKVNFSVTNAIETINTTFYTSGDIGSIINITFYATDKSGNVAQNSTLVEIRDRKRPVVKISANNSLPAVNDIVNIFVNVTDENGLLSANITYNLNGALSIVNFSLSGHSAEINHLISINTFTGDTINITVYATDTSNNVIQKSIFPEVAEPSIITSSSAYGDPQSFIVADSYVDKADPNSNFGNSEYVLLTISSPPEKRGYWMINLSNVTGTITKANFVCRIGVDGGYESTLESYWSNGTFSESGITWNNQPCGTTESLTELPCNQSVISAKRIRGNILDNITFDLTNPAIIAHEQAFYDKHFILFIRHKKESTLDQDVRFHSKENNDPERRCGLYMVVQETDSEPPQIELSINNTNPNPNDIINISATIDDNIGLLHANFTYNLSEGMVKLNFTVSGANAHVQDILEIARGLGEVINVTAYATDTNNNVVQKSALVQVVDSIAPIINLSLNNTSPKTNELVNISASISDEIGLLGANITYNVIGSKVKINFTLSGNKAKIAHIANISDTTGALITIEIYATDTSNNIKRESVVITVADSIPPIITLNSPKNNSNMTELPVLLQVSTNENSKCDYSLTSGPFIDLQEAKGFTVTLPPEISIEGDYWKVGTSTKKLELSEDLTTGGINREILSNITTFIQKGDLKVLDSGSVTNNKATSPYNQYMYLLGPMTQKNMDSGYVLYTESSDDDTSADFLFFKSGREIGRYLLEFTTAFESDVDDSNGVASPTGLFLTDYEDVDIKMLGKTYTIVTAKRTSTVGNNVVLTLMSGVAKDTLLEKQTKTYTIGGKDYEVTLNFVDSDDAQFTVNGQTTRKMKEDDTDKLADGTTVGVTDVLYQDYAGGIHSATFFIGAEKIELKDTNIKDIESSNALKVDDNTIDDAQVIIEGSDNNITFKINRIHVNMTADDDYYVASGSKLSNAIKQEGGSTAEPEVLFTQNWDFEYKGLSQEVTEKVKIITSGSDQYNLEFIGGDGNKVSVPIAKAPNGSSLVFGDQQGRAFINKENKTISKDDYFVLSDSSELRKRGEKPTFVLQYKGADKVTNDNPVLKFKNLGSGNTIEQTYSAAPFMTLSGPNGDVGELATLKVGGSDFKIYNSTSIKSNDFGILIDLNADGLVTSVGGINPQYKTEPVVITTKNGMEINITNESGTIGNDNSDIVYVTFRVPDNSRDEGARDSIETLQATVMRWNITAASAKVQMVQDTTTERLRLNLRTPDGETNIAYGYDSYGSKYTYETPTNDPALLTIEVPAKQRVPLVYITANSKTTYTHSDALSNLTEGEHKIVINCSDAAQNQNNIFVLFNFVTLPKILGVSPKDGTVNVSSKISITANVSEDINISTLTKSSFIVKQYAGNKVNGSLNFDNVTKSIIFKPILLLKYNTTYTVNITKDIKDLFGNSLDKDYYWTFATAQKDTDNDGIPDTEDDDLDNDGINDTIDFLIGNISNVNSNLINLDISVDSSANLSANLSGRKRVKFSQGNNTLLEFDFDLGNNSMLDLTNLSIL